MQQGTMLGGMSVITHSKKLSRAAAAPSALRVTLQGSPMYLILGLVFNQMPKGVVFSVRVTSGQLDSQLSQSWYSDET